MSKFNIGDIVEGTETNRWVRGSIKSVHDFIIEVDVIDSDKRGASTWYIRTENASLSKSYIIYKIISEL